MRSRFLLGLFLAATAAFVPHAGAQGGFARDTVSPRYARARDELPEFFGAIAAVVDTGFGPAMRDFLTRDIATIRPPATWTPRMLTASRTFLVTTAFRGRETRLRLFVYWYDTSIVAVRMHGNDSALLDAIDSVLLERRMAKLVPPPAIRLSATDIEPFSNSEKSFSYSFTVASVPHCPAYEFDKRMRWSGDTLLVQVLGVPAPGQCPNSAGLRGSSYWASKPPGKYFVVFDSRGDTNVVWLNLTDTSIALVPLRATYVSVDEKVKWRYPSSSVTLRCRRRWGDPRLCDALHEFVLSQPGIVPYEFPPGGAHPLGYVADEERVRVYRYADPNVAALIRQCVASIPQQTRLDAGVRLYGGPLDGRWWSVAAYGSSSGGRGAPAEALDANGNIESTCGMSGSPARVAGATDPPRPVISTRVSDSSFERTSELRVDARSNGWVMLTQLRSSPFDRSPTAHVFARAVDAVRWVRTIRDVMAGRAPPDEGGGSPRFIPTLGRGRVFIDTRITDSAGYPKVSLQVEHCNGPTYGTHLNGAGLLRLAAHIEMAANLARSASPIATAPAPAHAYDSDDVSCPAAAINDSARTRSMESLRGILAARVRFVVDTSGRVDPTSIAVLPTRPRQIADLIRAALEQWRYQPAELAGVRVRQRVELTLPR